MVFENNLDRILEDDNKGIININYEIDTKEVDYSVRDLDYLKIYHEFSEIHQESNQGYQGLIHNSESDPDYNHLFF